MFNSALVRIANPTPKFSDLSKTLWIQKWNFFVNTKFCTANLSDHLGSKFHLSEEKSFVYNAPGALGGRD